MSERTEFRIADQTTAADWQERKAVLVPGSTPETWKAAFDDFFVTRLETRYYAPIRHLQGMKEIGVGFSIVALQCSLIEFLGATLEGKTYRHNSEERLSLRDKLLSFVMKSRIRRAPQPNTYSNSKKVFVQFLRTAQPFRATFTTKALAEDFYTGVRCALLHEARTKNRWTIRTRRGTGPFIDAQAKIIYRNDLQTAFEEFVTWYGEALPTDKKLQEAFIRKFDSLCED